MEQRAREQAEEEEWDLRDVVFVEDIKTAPVGKVLKVDGAYAAVRFPTMSKDSAANASEDPGALLQVGVFCFSAAGLSTNIAICLDLYLSM